MWLDGVEWGQITVPRERLMGGAHLHVEVGAEPSAWAQGSVPSSLGGAGVPRPPRDLTDPDDGRRRAFGHADAHRVFDDESSTPSAVLAPDDMIGRDFGVSTEMDHYTITAMDPGEYEWALEAVNQDGRWHAVDRCVANFEWPRRTRIFAVPGGVCAYAYRVIMCTPVHLAQVELLRLE